ncbi:MAG: phosphate signaling complex protein PhoU [Opitutaceae bacterium]|nr:phosphate signaling complex protein PhoU [Opitutaceae bacterium]
MKRFFDAELETFRTHLIKMGETAITQMQDAMKALAEADIGLADRVIARDDELDDLEIQIDEEAIRYMNLRAPVASDLRLVIVGMKASHDFERVGDEATGIAKRTKRLAAEPPLKPYVDLLRMAGLAARMLRDALDCFLHGDAAKAEAIIRRDTEVDALNKLIHLDLMGVMRDNPGAINRAIDLMFVSKSVERIADHATNLAEEMIYLAQGKDVRHDLALKSGWVEEGGAPTTPHETPR